MAHGLSSPRRSRTAASALLGVAALLVLPRTGDAAPDGGADAACVRVSTDARYIPYGWSHVVVLASSCSKDATCSVSTDVNPEKQNVTVPKGATVEVVTFLSSPSRQFNANVHCTLR
jgi:hypothetical protein